ncbi:N,N-dimethylformamidase beta subunit family domain-containing protein [Chachezhania sediminis]|uniref:N,N-dimethylformamidase beta subunit family domain-containing protein n=1 Tax=Chachezhania sediminis TaxID=2599291 RepID=UPI00131DFB05|nr:N,N-dimethylformamidase beta subunit family domain-containing protein [Chachezhania sediminis]
MIDSTKVVGYASPWSVAPGDTVRFHLSSEVLDRAQARIVRIRCADSDRNGPGKKVEHVLSPLDGEIALTDCPTYNGSWGRVPPSPTLRGLKEFSLGLWLFPTRVTGADQSVMARFDAATGHGWRLFLDSTGRLAFQVAADGESTTLTTAEPVCIREWIFVSASFSAPGGRLVLATESLAPDGGRAKAETLEVEMRVPALWPDDLALSFAACLSGQPDGPETVQHFNGKIDRPRLHATALAPAAIRALVETAHPAIGDPDLLGAWDFSQDIPGDRIVDLSAHALHGHVHRLPMRGVTGANWDGTRRSWTEAPAQYGAIHFHDDDIDDAAWPVAAEWTVPEGTRSGFYTLEASADHDGIRTESHMIFFVRPPRGTTTAKVCVIAPTATYLAYANNRSRIDQTHFEVMADGLMVFAPDDIYGQKHREYGSSVYDTHMDDSGVCYSSAHRPILNGRPSNYTFNYVNDTHLLDWLEEQDIAYDVVTDEDLHREGAGLLAPYPVVLTMTHPEYTSKQMLDGLQAYQNGGGRHMYLGGNGFYWRIAFHPTRPGIIELRRGITGLRSWEAEAGEDCLSFTGEPSGLWRSVGRAPQRLTGVGFSAQVFDRSTFYRRLPDSDLPRASFVMEGVDPDERIGDFGLRMGGAAGLEIDRADPDLGTSPDAMILATADRTGPGGIPAPEELPALYRGFSGEESSISRADIVLTPTARGGAVFSVGSIAWCCSLSHNGYDNNVSRITGNVLRRFLDPEPV